MSSEVNHARRADRLARLFRDVLSGARKVETVSDAKLFLQAVQSQHSPATCVERLFSSPSGLPALRSSLLADLSTIFIRSYTIESIRYLSDPGVKSLASGQLLQQLLITIAKPPTLWNALCIASLDHGLPEDNLEPFAWLALELLSLPASAEVDVTSDVQRVMQSGLLLKASAHETRQLGYKIQSALQLKSTPIVGNSQFVPGGRHDNDFVDFRQIAIYPSADELLSAEQPFLRLAREAFEADPAGRAKIHLDNQFRLLRENMLADLRGEVQVATGIKKPRRVPFSLGKLVPIGIDVGSGRFRKKCCITVSCYSGLLNLTKKDSRTRKKYLNEHPTFLRHQAFGVLIRQKEIYGFAFIDRDIDLLCQSPPVVCLQFTDGHSFKKALLALKAPDGVKFVLVDTAVFAVEPVLERLKEIAVLPLEGHLMNPQNPDKCFEPHLRVQELVSQLLSRAANEDGTTTIPEVAKATGDGTTREPIQLDASQMKSIIEALTNAIGLIQGPPGTGKSFLGALIVKFLYYLTRQKILITTYTNHALDQCLDDVQKMGIHSNSIVRLGSKSAPGTAGLLLSAQKSAFRRSKEGWVLINIQKELMSGCDQDLSEAFSDYARFNMTFDDIMEHLEFSEDDSRFRDAFIVPDDRSGFKHVGKKGKEIKPDYLYRRWESGEDAGIFKQHANDTSTNVWKIEPPARAALVQKWAHEMLEERVDKVEQLARKHDVAKEVLDNVFGESKQAVLMERRIIGCTTTSAAKYAKMIRAAEPDVILVEEAGEILESHILTALTPSVKQIILIGDHKQLRPKVDNYALTVEKGSGFDLNRSLFERLILQGRAHTTLHKQHRMCPEISIFSREDTYPEMVDAPSTLNRPLINGLLDRVIFINHGHPEAEEAAVADRRDPESKSSKHNVFEAEMVIKCVRYLGQQGYGTQDMVVLTPYLGQLRLLKDRLSLDNDPVLNELDSFDLVRAGLMTEAAAKITKRPLKISTIDNYQGEESNIVIVSVTRSNNAGDIGFMASPERLNVLRTRSRNCLIMIGNVDTFMASRKGRDTWLPFLESLKKKGHLYDGLPVKCEKHPQTTALLKEPRDFDKCCPDGGCAEPCGAIFKCKVHKCRLRCHRLADHSKVECTEQVDKTCERKHMSRVLCGKRNETCAKCREEDEEQERRIKRDLQLEATRLSKEEAYKRELQEIQDEIDHKRRVIRYQDEAEKQQQTLKQQRADLAALRDTAQRVVQARSAASAKSPASTQGDGGPSGGVAASSLDLPSRARDEWEHMKKYEGDQSAALDEVMAMIGLEEVKQEFLSIKSIVDTAIRQRTSLASERFSCSLLGNPGTGKTTVARLLAKFLNSVGVIPGSCFKETTGAGLANVGVSGCKKLIEEILNDGGGILFIDEAYQLTSGTNPGGGAVLDYLLPEVENLRGKVVFILAGYNKQMESFFAHNPGLPSRFPIEMKFADYTDDELLRILVLKVNEKYKGRMNAEGGLQGLYCRIVSRRIGRGRGTDGFGNARAVENNLATICKRQVNRLRRERQAGRKPSDLLLTKEDLIGPEPSGALKSSEAWQKLQELIGLKAVKEAVGSLVDSIRQNYLRELDEQPPIQYSLNKVFLGSPGTGKTTVAKLYGAILVDLGLLSKGEVVVKNPSDFVGAHIGHSEQQTKGILAATIGKVLVIDEAYGLYGGGGTQGSNVEPFKTAVIDTIVAEVQSVPGDDRCVLLLGYRNQMETMFQNVNPGLSRRFPLASAFEFEDFSDDELRTILDLKLKQQGFDATDQARRVAMEMLGRARNRPNFGNGGEIDILLDAAKARHQPRLSRGEAKSASILEAVDFDENWDRAERQETNVAKLFEGTVGQERVVALLERFQETVRTFKSLNMDPKENIPFNFLFRGPPGTGKTTTAEKMGKVFYDMGFLATAEVVQCSATDLVGQYVGQTGPKVLQLLDKALGKVLFIDEAYRLGEGAFAKEAMDEIVDATTKPKYSKKLVIILAGYEADINRLMATNPGLTSRFPEVIDFRALEPRECIALLRSLLRKQKASLKKRSVELDLQALETSSEAFLARMVDLLDHLAAQESWASARDVQSLAKAIFNDAIRPANRGAAGQVVVTEGLIEAELVKMLRERQARSRDAILKATVARPLCDGEVSPHATIQEQRKTHATTTTASTSAIRQDKTAEDPASDDLEPPRPNVEARKEKEEDTVGSAPERFRRDAGVSDAVWEQLQRDRRAEEAREEEHQRLVLAARNEASEAARARIVARLLEDERRREAEAEAKRKLEALGLCPVGYEWIRQAGGYRCAGGSHFLVDDALECL